MGNILESVGPFRVDDLEQLLVDNRNCSKQLDQMNTNIHCPLQRRGTPAR